MGNFLYKEKVTVCIGAAIIYLGLSKWMGHSEISAALVTGISVSGFLLTLSDFLNKLFDDIDYSSNEKIIDTLKFVDIILYMIAAMCIIALPNSKFFTSLDKDTLDKMSTVASVVALGFVFVTIGFSNIEKINEEKRKQNENLDKVLTFAENTLNNNKELDEKTSKLIGDMLTLIKNQDNANKELHEKIKELENNKSPV